MSSRSVKSTMIHIAPVVGITLILYGIVIFIITMLGILIPVKLIVGSLMMVVGVEIMVISIVAIKRRSSGND